MIDFRTARILVRALRALTQTLVWALALMALTCAMVFVQSQRDETRPADAALVLGAAAGPQDPAGQAELDRALALHRRSVVTRIILVAPERSGRARRYLTDRGAPDAAVLESPAGATLSERLAGAAAAARAAGASSLVVIGEPAEMLRALKIVRDAGLSAYASPARLPGGARSPADDIRATVREAWDYLAYLFFRP